MKYIVKLNAVPAESFGKFVGAIVAGVRRRQVGRPETGQEQRQKQVQHLDMKCILKSEALAISFDQVCFVEVKL